MNRKIFALLLILPVAVFAADRLTASNVNDGGGKDKKLSKTATTATATPVEANPEVALETPTQAQQTQTKTIANSSTSPLKTTVTTAVLTTDEKMALIDGAIEDLDIAYNEMNSEDQLTYMYPDEMDQQLYKWLNNHIMTPMEKVNPMKINLERSFSRCTSGYRISLVTSDGKITNEGWLLGDQGCWQRPMGKFQYDVADGKVNVHLGTSDSMVPLQEIPHTFQGRFQRRLSSQ